MPGVVPTEVFARVITIPLYRKNITRDGATYRIQAYNLNCT